MMQIIDTHTHIFDEEICRDYFTKAKRKVGKAIVIHFSTLEEGGRFRDFSLDELLEFVARKENLFVVGSVNMDEDVQSQLRRLAGLMREGRIFGIKLYPGYQHFYPSDDMVFPVAELCEKYDKPLIFHSGDVYDSKKRAVLKYSHPIHIDGLATKYPMCKIVVAHFGFPYHLETANVVSKNKNVYTEISGTIDRPDTPGEAESLFGQYVADLNRAFAYFPDAKSKTMFGTDYCGEKTPLNQVEPYIHLVEKIWSKNECGKVFHELADKLFFPKPC